MFTVVVSISLNKLQIPVTPCHIKYIDNQSHYRGLFWSRLGEKRNSWRSLIQPKYESETSVIWSNVCVYYFKTLICFYKRMRWKGQQVTTYGAGSWSVFEVTAKWLAAFERGVLRRRFGVIQVNKILRKWCNKELTQLFRVLDIVSFVRIGRLDCIGHVNRMDINRKISHVFKDMYLEIILREVD